MTATFAEITARRKAQIKYCTEHSILFAPSDGICWNCGKQIYDAITLEYASTQLVTGCPHCHRSFVD